ncbi:ribosomal protein L12E/L44/L45/RPP1/RPP2 [Kibdelosporangium banguiense]|uniref:Ribosomal protein L12E/L44/L45/RPP1/RPP2 n=1 Tax=Kibdelosporangium banguiense TaxID=1365924 RepID=A0ABS4TE33_9PSEU|nr:PPE domain-containing protein [Kibdelosporangium banguiense]MBP2322106.1 ribosomal protein L12E/L44/L45/RPP1/RPP2 [Kibdelosporangium banguiense]
MSDVRWMGLDHEAIYKMINSGGGPAVSGPPADFWGTLSSGLNDISTKLHEKLSTLNVNWEGQSSENAIAGMSPLKDWAGKAENGSDVMKTSYELQGNYVGEARAEVPPPVKVTTPAPSGWAVAGAVVSAATGNLGPAAVVAAQAADHEGQERAQDEAARKAVQAMQKYETSSDWNADTLGRFEEPPKLVVSTPPPAPNHNIGTVETSGMYNTTNVHHNQTTTSSVSHNTIPQTHTTPPPNIGNNIGPAQTTTPNQNIITPPAAYKPPMPKPGLPTPTQGGGGGQYQSGPFVPPGGPFPGNPSTSTGRGGPGMGRPGLGLGGGQGSGTGGGRGGVGGPGSGFGQNSTLDPEGRNQGARPGAASGNPMLQEGAVRGGAANAAGGRGAAGPMGAGGRRADGEEDEEHDTPDYLLETEDVFGDERLIAPSVIGEKPEQ